MHALRSSVLALWLCLHVSVRAWMTYRSANGLDEYEPEDRIIFLGTKWCGNGNVAEGPEDLGPLKETDACCREHDMCPDLIAAGQSKHGLTNTASYTRLNCGCDEKFYNCLKNSAETGSGAVRFTYFTVLGTKCYRNEHPLICVKKGWFSCSKYELDKSQPKRYQWFDVSSNFAFPRMLT
uniref:Phospholipase A2 n=1 Tax=Xylocopa aruana TaxID=135674 RepID=PA2_XYLAR|nr:venom phospholipase A2 [Xylocopa aruana]